MKKKLTQKRLKELLHYDPETGDWFWRVSIGKAKANSKAGSIGHGYRRIQIFKTPYRSSRLAFLYMLGYFPEHEAEHKNRIRDDDRWSNLREATKRCNNRNRGMMKSNRSGVSGVRLDRKYWVAVIGIKGKQLHLGSFDNKKMAVMCRWAAEKEYNFPHCCTKSSAYLYLKENGVI